MMVTGGMAWLRARGYFIMPTEMFILENFIRIELMGLGFMFIKMARNMKDSGKMTCKTVLEKKSLKTVPNTKECSKMAKSVAVAFTSGLITQFTQEIGKITISRVMVNIDGPTAVFIKAR